MDRGSRLFTGAVLVRWGWGLALAALVFATALTPVSDGDLWWHLAAGREMLATRGFLRVDPFTLSAAGRPWPDLHWLFQLSVHGLYQLGGLAAIIVAKAALVTGGAFVLLAATRRDPGVTSASLRPLFVMVLGTALFAARHLLLARPVVFTLVFLALFLLVLESYAARGDGRARVLLWLPALQILWVNSQGLFALGPAVIACYALGGALAPRLAGSSELPPRGARTLAGVLLLTLLACLITPFGLAGVALPVRLLARLAPAADNVFSSNIAENVPPWLLERTSPGQFTHFSWALAIVAGSLLVARRSLRLGRCFMVLLFAGLAFTANRNVLLFYWVGAPVVALNLAPAVDELCAQLRGRWPRVVLPVAAALPVLGLAALVAVAQAHETPINQPAPFRVPAGSVARLQALPAAPGAPPQRVFTADHHGGYLTWRLHPRYRPFIDTRLVLHTGDEYSDFLGLLDHPERFTEFQRRQAFDHVILPTAFPDRYLGLVQHLAAAPDWRLVYTDGTEVLFSRADTGASALDLGNDAVVQDILTQLAARDGAGAGPATTPAGQAARRHLARLLLVTDHLAQSLTVLATLPDGDADALALRARAHLLAGELERAEAAAQRLLSTSGEAAGPLDLLAFIALARGDTAAALEWLRRSLAADPFGAEATALLARLESEQKRSVVNK